jgi:hypothetical protein
VEKFDSMAGMPNNLPGMISEATKRHLERTYHSNQGINGHPSQNLNNGRTMASAQNDHSEAMQQILPARPQPSPVPSSTGTLEHRSLPSQAVTDSNFDDAYVNFIMYCNPSIPLETDTNELRKIFRAPPKSDGKTFSTFTLFELIRKLEEKELKTWAQLAIQLGVEPPALDKGQSAQKVQQYAVRLKVS